MFQSPSLRGSGRFVFKAKFVSSCRSCFNPLHCGAVVASGCSLVFVVLIILVSIPFIAGQWSLRFTEKKGEHVMLTVSIPFIAGQWSLHVYYLQATWIFGFVSIPFIAGQWSLLSSGGVRLSGGYWFQSPSLRGSGRFPLC